MKKLMIALGAVALAAVASASTMKWSVAGLDQYKDSTDYTMLCFIEADTTGAANSMLLNRTTAEGYAKAKNYAAMEDFIAKEKALEADGGKIGGLSAAFSTYKNQWINEQGAGTDYSGTFYAIIFNAEEIADATAYMITTSETVKYGASSSTAQSAALGAGTWVEIGGPVPPVVPEPTSAMLLLLGVAGLALRRRQA